MSSGLSFASIKWVVGKNCYDYFSSLYVSGKHVYGLDEYVRFGWPNILLDILSFEGR